MLLKAMVPRPIIRGRGTTVGLPARSPQRALLHWFAATQELSSIAEEQHQPQP